MDIVDRLRSARLARAVACALACAVGLGGCALGGGSGGVVPDAAALPTVFDEAVVADLAGVLEQSFEPRTTTVQVSRRGEDRVTRAIVRRLVEGGFGVQRVDVDQGPNLLSHARAIDREADGRRVTARLAVGSFAVRRTYRIDAAGRVSTAGPLRVYGAPAVLPYASLMHERLRIDDPSHLDIEYVAPRRTTPADAR